MMHFEPPLNFRSVRVCYHIKMKSVGYRLGDCFESYTVHVIYVHPPLPTHTHAHTHYHLFMTIGKSTLSEPSLDITLIYMYM